MVRGKIKTKIIVITSLLLCLLFLPLAPKAQAFELTTEVKATGRSWKPTQVRCRYHDGQVLVRDSVSCPVVNNAWLVQMEVLNPRVDFKEGLYYRTTMSFQWHKLSIGRELLWTPYTIDFFTLVNLTQTVNQDNTATSNAQSLPFSNIFDITLRANGTEGQGVFSFGDGTNAFAVVLPADNTAEGSVAMGTIYEYEVSDTLEKEKAENEQQGEQGQTDAEQAGNDAEQATQSLVSVIGDFFGAFINAQATTCEFDMGIILENVDLCAAYIPPVYNVILSIVSILMLVPMVLWLLSSISNAFKEFQQ